jgi:hypothetical protein
MILCLWNRKICSTIAFSWVMAASPRGKQKKIAGNQAGSDNDSSDLLKPLDQHLATMKRQGFFRSRTASIGCGMRRSHQPKPRGQFGEQFQHR